MVGSDVKNSFVARYLDPAGSLGEIVFGLIMVLSVTLGAGLATGEGPDGHRDLLLAAIGCNVAWGIIDAVLYLMNARFERSRGARVLAAVQRAPDEATALALIRQHFEPTHGGIVEEGERDRLYRSILSRVHTLVAPPVRLTRADLYGAIASFWLVVLSCIPAVVPFLLIRDSHTAMRVSNAALIGMLFVVGWHWARYTSSNRWVAGLGLVLLGLSLVGVAMALGG